MAALLERVRAHPGVVSAAVSSDFPLERQGPRNPRSPMNQSPIKWPLNNAIPSTNNEIFNPLNPISPTRQVTRVKAINRR